MTIFLLTIGTFDEISTEKVLAKLPWFAMLATSVLKSVYVIIL